MEKKQKWKSLVPISCTNPRRSPRSPASNVARSPIKSPRHDLPRRKQLTRKMLKQRAKDKPKGLLTTSKSPIRPIADSKVSITTSSISASSWNDVGDPDRRACTKPNGSVRQTLNDFLISSPPTTSIHVDDMSEIAKASNSVRLGFNGGQHATLFEHMASHPRAYPSMKQPVRKEFVELQPTTENLPVMGTSSKRRTRPFRSVYRHLLGNRYWKPTLFTIPE